VVAVNHRQIAAVRNAGARAASGEILVFLDADTVLPAQTLAAALAVLEEGAVGGGGEIQFDGEIPLYAIIALDAVKRLLRLLRVAAGCFMFCTREAFDATGGFDERLYASEECFLSLALRKQGRFVLLREPVITSGRKLRQYRSWQLLGTIGKMMLTGGRACRRREGLDVWYEGRREAELPEVEEIPGVAERD
jgi:GT2 family glycosyltransferase